MSLTVQQYAERHGVSARTVWRWVKAGRVPVNRYSARTVRIELAPACCARCGEKIVTVSDRPDARG